MSSEVILSEGESVVGGGEIPIWEKAIQTQCGVGHQTAHHLPVSDTNPTNEKQGGSENYDQCPHYRSDGNGKLFNTVFEVLLHRGERCFRIQLVIIVKIVSLR